MVKMWNYDINIAWMKYTINAYSLFYLLRFVNINYWKYL